MADENFRIDPDALEDINKKLRAVGEDLTASFNEMKTTLEDHWGCWGNDDIGEAFIKNFEEPNKKLQEGAEAMSGAPNSFADQIDKQIEAVRKQDAANRAAIEQNEYGN
ncbi:MAG: hypothetical protein IJH84_25720 [Saccharopolyspora sp.]|uniref:hypothetical protein n=1 Tax=Saccharopolyspora sp. TaxID=33915 RepID=UPI0025F85355|nr:hypothetical protein [Saccharopolyspora sp.]MBQ6644410.1 hypothetical protein [Saccharopolyspora sp.]